MLGLLKPRKHWSSEGYVSSDEATAADQFIYTTPLNRNSMTVFRSGSVGKS